MNSSRSSASTAPSGDRINPPDHGTIAGRLHSQLIGILARNNRDQPPLGKGIQHSGVHPRPPGPALQLHHHRPAGSHLTPQRQHPRPNTPYESPGCPLQPIGHLCHKLGAHSAQHISDAALRQGDAPALCGALVRLQDAQSVVRAR